MDKLKIGIPRGLFYYQNRYMWKYFFEKLGFEVVLSQKTNHEIIKLGNKYSNDEMCLSMKVYLGHVATLINNCDYVLVPRIDNYGLKRQTCTNFLSAFDIVNNIFDLKILNYNVNYSNGKTERQGFFYVGKQLGKSYKTIKTAYDYAKIKSHKIQKKIYIDTLNKLIESKPKILLVGHDYNVEDELVGKWVVDYLEKNNYEVIKSYELPKETTIKLSSKISKTLYWKQNRENVGAIAYSLNKVDGIILLSSFPCGPDSIVNELVLRRVKLPILNIVVDDLSSFSGFETRLESFLDIINEKCKGG